MRIKIQGKEWDAFTRWRKYTSFKPGVLKWIKRNYNKRVRRKAKEAIKNEI